MRILLIGDIFARPGRTAVQRVLPVSQIAVVPGTSHGLLLEKPHVVNQLLVDFLADEQVPKMFAFDD